MHLVKGRNNFPLGGPMWDAGQQFVTVGESQHSPHLSGDAAMKTSRAMVLGVLCLGVISRANADTGSLFGQNEFGGDVKFVLEGATANVTPKMKDGVKTRPYFARDKSFTLNVKKYLDEFWQVGSDSLAKELPKSIAKANLKFKGFSPYDVRFHPVQKTTLKALVVKDTIQLEYAIRGNSVEAHFTTPDVVDIKTPIGRIHGGAPKAADPRVILHFDLVVRVNVTPQLKGVPSLSHARIEIQNARLQPGNHSADVLKFANDVVAWFGGPNFKVMVEETINKQGVSAAAPLAKAIGGLNQKIAPLTANARDLTVAHIGNEIRVIYSTKVDKGPIVK
jgi:hypothetical protein